MKKQANINNRKCISCPNFDNLCLLGSQKLLSYGEFLMKTQYKNNFPSKKIRCKLIRYNYKYKYKY